MNEIRPSSGRTRYLLPVIYIAVLLVLYLGFYNRYFPEYIDDAWTLSWAWNFFENGEVYDTVFGYLDGDGGSALFSRTTVLIYGAVYSLLDLWGHREVGYILSTLFLFAGVFCWFKILRGLDYDRTLALWFTGVMLLLELYFGAGHRIRVEAPGFFLASLSLLLFVRGKYFPSALIGMIGAENHPYGLVFIPWALAVLALRWPEIRKEPRKYLIGALWFFGGLVAGAGYWLLLHYPWISGLKELSGRAGGNPFLTYFFLKRYSWRHWPELLVTLFSLVIFLVRKLWKKDRFILPLLIACIATSLLIPRGNNHYVVYLYPPIILLILTVFRHLNRLNLLLAGLLIFQIPQYGLLFWPQRDYSQSAHLQTLKTHVAAAEQQTGPLPIFGNSNAWFAFYDREFRAYGYWSRSGMSQEDWPDRFLMIENRDFRRDFRNSFRKHSQGILTRTELSRFSCFDDSEIVIALYRRHGEETP